MRMILSALFVAVLGLSAPAYAGLVLSEDGALVEIDGLVLSEGGTLVEVDGLVLSE